MKRAFYLVLFVLILILGMTFAVHNSQSVAVRYYFDLQWQGPLSLFLLIALFVGSILGFLGGLGLVFRARRRLNQTQKDLKKMEQEITNLRSLPLKDVM